MHQFVSTGRLVPAFAMPLRISRLSQLKSTGSNGICSKICSKICSIWDDIWYHPVGRFLSILLLVIWYVAIGVAFYMYTEGWTFIESAYFSMVTMSTVGYGDFTPTTSGSRVFTIFYTLLGIIVVFTQLSALMITIVAPGVTWLRATTDRLLPQQGYDIDGNGVADYYVPQAAVHYYVSKLFLPFCCVMVLQLAFAAVFVAVEGWDYGTSLYHCMITASTSGYGDVAITNDRGMILAFFHIAVSVSLLGALIGEIDTVRGQRQVLLKRHHIMLAKMDPKVWESVLRDSSPGGGIHQLDFVCGMLVKLDLVRDEDINVLTKLWDQLGKDKNDTVRQHELASIAAKYRSRNSIIVDVGEDGRARTTPRPSMLPRSWTRTSTIKTGSGASKGGSMVLVEGAGAPVSLVPSQHGSVQGGSCLSSCASIEEMSNEDGSVRLSGRA